MLGQDHNLLLCLRLQSFPFSHKTNKCVDQYHNMIWPFLFNNFLSIIIKCRSLALFYENQNESFPMMIFKFWNLFNNFKLNIIKPFNFLYFSFKIFPIWLLCIKITFGWCFLINTDTFFILLWKYFFHDIFFILEIIIS